MFEYITYYPEKGIVLILMSWNLPLKTLICIIFVTLFLLACFERKEGFIYRFLAGFLLGFCFSFWEVVSAAEATLSVVFLGLFLLLHCEMCVSRCTSTMLLM